MTLRYKDLPQIPVDQLRVNNTVDYKGIHVTVNSVTKHLTNETFNTVMHKNNPVNVPADYKFWKRD